MKTVRSRAPLRLGLGGGGTDLKTFSSSYDGAVLNATIDMYAHCIIKEDHSLILKSEDLEIDIKSLPEKQILDGKLNLHKAVYNRIMQDFNNNIYLPISISTFVDAPSGSGLGSSSTLVVALIKALQEYLGFSLTEYELAQLAFDIERVDCDLAGGQQDQYCASFGGINYMEFLRDDSVVVNPLKIKKAYIAEFERSTILFYTGQSRESANIIKDQVKATSDKQKLDGLMRVKKAAKAMKDCVVTGNYMSFFALQKEAWEAKKITSNLISNNEIEGISKVAFDNNAKAIKVSGAGGGGFMMIFTDPADRERLVKVLKELKGKVYNFHISLNGAESWTVK